MYSVYQHWDPLKVCIVGKSYPPEFYSWIKNPKTRSIFEQIAQETEEDFQSLIKILKKFNVEVLRPDIPNDYNELLNPITNRYIPSPLTPRDDFGMYGNTLLYSHPTINKFYNDVKDQSWPCGIFSFADLQNLPKDVLFELTNIFKMDFRFARPSSNKSYDTFYKNMFNVIKDKCNINTTESDTSTASNCRIGKDIYVNSNKAYTDFRDLFQEYRFHNINKPYHTDSVFCPVVPGLIISLEDIPTYKDTFPGWEVVYLPDQSWVNVKPFLDLKEKNQGKWWIPGEEYNDDVTETVNTWMSNWVGYVEETVFDINMLVINEKNVVVNNYNKQVFDALERHGVTPHICNFRHRYFWDGGLHCITSDVSREGVMKDYFPERG